MVFNSIKGIIFLFETVFGIAGNILVCVNYMWCFQKPTEKKSIYPILIHLAFTNIITLLSKGMPKTIVAFGMRNILDDISCKMVVFLERASQGLSICTTSHLTVIQAISISPNASKWNRFKPRSAWHIVPFFSFFWILNSLLCINLLYSIRSKSLNISQPNNTYNCYFRPDNLIMNWIFLMLMVLRDAVFQGIMGAASGYMVFLLHKHHQRVVYLHHSKILYKTPPEIRAAKSVLLLMFCFLFFYWIDCVLSVLLSFSLQNNFMLNIREFLTLGFAIFSPVVLIHRDGHLAEDLQAQWKRKTLRKCLSHINPEPELYPEYAYPNATPFDTEDLELLDPQRLHLADHYRIEAFQFKHS
ncbi:putative vomeronasal receptor-like protein 4 [Perognathus longimembris pacificus]|uniref:putative vomeronasal receptor-like protein 4 n=1 Tax=Perognathus longimembris pacificus TaxID=214514 RepID=UPI0020199F46|nr:putative vomeronasal receptor-like protein 4 [Perognathus longimembris pacificus]